MIFESFNEAYVAMIRAILEGGEVVAPRMASSLGSTREILAAGFDIPSTQPLCTLEHRKLSYAFCMLEPLYLFTHQNETDIASALMAYAPNLRSLAYNTYTGKFDGNYGDRLHLSSPVSHTSSAHNGILSSASSQLLRVFDVLSKDPQSRRAVITIHNPVWDIVNGDSMDIPCTLSLQFMIRNKKLHCFCTMRSNDIWYGTPHNVMMFTFLQRTLAAWLNIDPGMYSHRANSLHLYDAHETLARRVLEEPTLLPRNSEILYPCTQDPKKTLARLKELRIYEEMRRSGAMVMPRGMETWQPMPGYEADLVKDIDTFWARKAAQSKAS